MAHCVFIQQINQFNTAKPRSIEDKGLTLDKVNCRDSGHSRSYLHIKSRLGRHVTKTSVQIGSKEREESSQLLVDFPESLWIWFCIMRTRFSGYGLLEPFLQLLHLRPGLCLHLSRTSHAAKLHLFVPASSNSLPVPQSVVRGSRVGIAAVYRGVTNALCAYRSCV